MGQRRTLRKLPRKDPPIGQYCPDVPYPDDIVFEDRPVDELLFELLSFLARPNKRQILTDVLQQRFTSLRHLLCASWDELMVPKQMTEMVASGIVCFRSIHMAYCQCVLEKYPLDKTTKDCLAKLFMFRRCDSRDEIIDIAYFDKWKRLMPCGVKVINTGLSSEVTFNVKFLVRNAIREEAPYAVISHCHTNGNPEPSDADRHATKFIANLLSFIGIELLDHIIVAGPSTFSFADSPDCSGDIIPADDIDEYSLFNW